MKKAIFPIVWFLAVALMLGSALTIFAGQTVGEKIDDATITKKVRAELLGDVKFDMSFAKRLGVLKTVQVETNNGEVTLTGKVHTQEQKSQAKVVAEKVDGVVKVQNMLTVVPEQ